MKFLKSKKVLIPMALTVGLVLSAVLVTAFDYHPHQEMIHDFINYRIDREFEALALSAEQKAQIDVLRQKIWSELETAHETRLMDKQEIFNELAKATPDAAYIKTLIDKKIDNVQNVAYDIVDLILEVHQVLTPEQRTQLLTRIEELHAQHGGPHGPCLH
jgi:Spy/CpxP family protein refolding chaperone